VTTVKCTAACDRHQDHVNRTESKDRLSQAQGLQTCDCQDALRPSGDTGAGQSTHGTYILANQNDPLRRVCKIESVFLGAINLRGANHGMSRDVRTLQRMAAFRTRGSRERGGGTDHSHSARDQTNSGRRPTRSSKQIERQYAGSSTD
jgi:hypothetical protein